MLEYTHRSRLLPQNLGDVGHLQPGKHAEQNHLSLVRRKSGDALQRSFGVGSREHGALGVVWCGSPTQGIETDTQAGAALPAAPMIDQPPACDRKEPAPKGPLITLETVETGGRVKPRFRDEILPVIGFLRPKVPQKPRMELPVEGRECPLCPRPSRGHHRAKLLSKCHPTSVAAECEEKSGEHGRATREQSASSPTAPVPRGFLVHRVESMLGPPT
jgi:hypothetical protein